VNRVGDGGRTLLAASVIVVGILVLGADPASAQMFPEGRLAVHANFGYQFGSEELRQRMKLRVYGEDARFLATHDTVGGLAVDLGGFIDVWARLSVGASYAQTQGSDTTAVTGTVPHPILSSSDRTIAAETLDLAREERSVHIHAAWLIDLPIDKFDMRVMGGPSYFNLTQGVVTGVVVSEAGSPPFQAVNVDRIATGQVIKNAWGGHAGVDVSYMFMPSVGVGGFVRFARGTVSLPTGDTDVSVTVGGLQIGGGARFRF
jgi:hypothetical protein